MLSTSATSASCRKRRAVGPGSLGTVMDAPRGTAGGSVDQYGRRDAGPAAYLWTTSGGPAPGPTGCCLDRRTAGAGPPATTGERHGARPAQPESDPTATCALARHPAAAGRAA